jgi:O-antigen ligase
MDRLRTSPVPIATAKTIGRRPGRRRLWPSSEAFFTELGILLLGLAGAASVNVVGSLPGNELLLFPLAPVLLLRRGGRAFRREYIWFYVLVFGWLLGTLIADAYRGMPAAYRLKGIARVLFFILDFIVLAILINEKTRRMVVFALSIAGVTLFLSRNYGDFPTKWKFGLASFVTISALLAASYYYARRRFRVCTVIYLVIVALDLKFAARSQMVIVLVAAVFTIPIFDRGQALARGRPSHALKLLKPVGLLVLAGAAAFLADRTIRFAATQGLFEGYVSDKFQAQSQGKLGVLFGGRPETLVAIQAIRDSPIIGHGSFAAEQRYLDLKADLLYENGYSDADVSDDIEGHGIPTHSHLTMAWVESGILGGLLWIYVLILVVRAILRIAVSRPNLSPLYCYLLVNFLWDILYSPFGSTTRIWGAYLILLSFHLLKTPNQVLPSVPQAQRSFYRPRTINRTRVAWRKAAPGQSQC